MEIRFAHEEMEQNMKSTKNLILYKNFENGKLFWVKQNNHLVQSFDGATTDELLFILNHNCFIRAKNMNDREFV